MEQLRAKVFISCGQRKETEETKVAQQIRATLEEMGFEAYVAVQQQTLTGLRENIFKQLETSEYLLFIDFRREQFANSPEHRGSLFSNQELAVASFLDISAIAFQQKGVKLLDGMLGAFQVNAIEFNNPEEIPEMVRKQVEIAGWRHDWKNVLRVIRNPSQFDEAFLVNVPNNPRARFFHVTVENLNRNKIAVNCTGYVEAIRNLTANSNIPFMTAELKWAGYIFPTAAIMPASQRLLDAIYILHDSPQIAYFNCFTDSGYYMKPIQGPGQFQLDYVVISENFSPARIRLNLTLENLIDQALLILAE